MSDNIIYIDSKRAEDIMYATGDEPYIKIRTGERHRWYTDMWYVFENRDNGKLYEFCNMDPATESQEGQDEWDDPEAIPCYEVEPYEVTITEYRRVQ